MRAPVGRGGKARMGPTSISLDLHGLVDEHDGNVVLDPVAELAGLADEPVLLRGELEIALALRARENLEQLLADAHAVSSWIHCHSRESPSASPTSGRKPSASRARVQSAAVWRTSPFCRGSRFTRSFFPEISSMVSRTRLMLPSEPPP